MAKEKDREKRDTVEKTARRDDSKQKFREKEKQERDVAERPDSERKIRKRDQVIGEGNERTASWVLRLRLT